MTNTTNRKHRRRGNGEGTIRKRADGRWEAIIMVGIATDGKPKYKSVYGHTRAEAIRKLDEVRKDLYDGLDLTGDLTLGRWCDIWYKGHKGKVSAVTYDNYRYTVETIKRVLGSRKLREIRTLDIEKALQELRDEGFSDSKMKKVRGMLYQVFSKAAANDLIRKNPVQYAEKMRSESVQKEKETFTEDEIRKIMIDLPEDRLGWSIRLLVGTGMREQELLALEPKHIEKNGSVIHVRQAVKRIKGKVSVGCTKSKDSVRDIPVPKNLQAYAVKLRTVETKYIWQGRGIEAPYDPTHFRKNFKAALEKIGVRPLNPHEARHTYVSQLQACGVDIETIRQMTGHADTTMTEHYLHVRASILKEAAEKLNPVFG